MLTHRDLIVTMNTIVVTGVLRVYVTLLCALLLSKGGRGIISRHVSRLDLHTIILTYPEFYTTNSE